MKDVRSKNGVAKGGAKNNKYLSHLIIYQ